MIWMTQKQIQIEGPLEMLFYLAVAMAIGFLGSLLIAFVVKFVFRKYSRYAIGA
jgi:hypothetical protein